MSPILPLFLAAALVSGCAHGSGPARDAPVAAAAPAPDSLAASTAQGFSPERLARVTSVMQGYVDRGEVSGVVSLVQHKGEVVHGDVLGFQDREAAKPMQRDTIFRIYSMTKPITSVAVLMLIEEGKLRLTEPVGRLLPELAEPRVLRHPKGRLSRTRPARTPITVRDLLTHTSGLAYAFTSEGPLSRALTNRGLLGSSSDMPPDAWMARLGELPLLMDPGTQWHYSLSTDVLGVLVERASGLPFADFLRTRLFEPLGMTDTAFYVPEAKRHRLAVNYAKNPETGAFEVFDHPDTTTYAEPKAFSSGGGGLVSTVDDYLRFASMIAGQGELDGVRVLSRKSVELMTTNALTDEERAPAPFGARFFARGRGFGLGVQVTEDVGLTAGLGSPGTNGWGGAAGTWYWVDPQEDLVGVMMIQRMGGGRAVPIRSDFETLVYQALD